MDTASYKKTEKKDDQSLETLVTDFMQQIKNSNWLNENTVEKLKEDNPTLAEEYKKAMLNVAGTDNDANINTCNEKSSDSTNSSLENMLRDLNKEIQSSTWMEDQVEVNVERMIEDKK